MCHLVLPPIPKRAIENLNLRASPDDDAAVIAVVQRGAEIGVDGSLEDNGRVLVTLSGWVAKSYLEDVDV